MMTSINRILCFTLIALTCACSKGGSNDNPNTNPPNDGQVEPTKALATLPSNGDVCSEYSEIPNDPDNIEVAFKWTSTQNTSSYAIKIFESTTELYSATLTGTETTIALQKGKAYSWQITTSNANSDTLSDTFSFSTPGEAIDNYIPYTAEITMTFDTDANTLAVSWVGNDEDGDALTYDLRIEEGTMEIVNEVDLIETNHGPIDAVPGSVYTVEVRSKDTAGNTSVSTQSRLME